MSIHQTRRRGTAVRPTTPSTTIRPPRRADIYPWWVWAATPAVVIVAVGAMILAH